MSGVKNSLQITLNAIHKFVEKENYKNIRNLSLNKKIILIQIIK